MVEILALSVGLLAAATAPPTETRTAVVIAIEDGELPPVETMSTWFLVDGQPQRVLAVDKGPAEVVVVRDPSVQPVLELLSKAFIEREMHAAGVVNRLPGTHNRALRPWDASILQLEASAFAEQAREYFALGKRTSTSAMLVPREALKRRCRLGEGASLRFVSPRAAPVSRTADTLNIFNLTSSFKTEFHGFMTFVERVPAMSFSLRLGDAIWLAGDELHTTARRRAIIAMIDGRSHDGSLYDTDSVREVLQELQVPVFAWSFRTGKLSVAWDGQPMIDETAEGMDPQDALQRFEQACEDAKRTLDRQRVVWLEGAHAPWEIELSAGAVGGVGIAGRPRPAALDELPDGLFGDTQEDAEP